MRPTVEKPHKITVLLEKKLLIQNELIICGKVFPKHCDEGKAQDKETIARPFTYV